MSYYFLEDRKSEEGVPARESLIDRHKEEVRFFNSVVDVISFDMANLVHKIERIKIIQLLKLRYFLHLPNFLLRFEELTKDKHIQSAFE